MFDTYAHGVIGDWFGTRIDGKLGEKNETLLFGFDAVLIISCIKLFIRR